MKDCSFCNSHDIHNKSTCLMSFGSPLLILQLKTLKCLPKPRRTIWGYI